MVDRARVQAEKFFTNWEARAKRMEEMSRSLGTPGWQYYKCCIIYILLLIIFGVIYQVVIQNNPDEWNIPVDANGNRLPVNGVYFASSVHATIGYGDYSPLSARAITLVVVHVLLVYIVVSLFLK